MNLFEAGLDILYVLMTIDNEIAESELGEMMRFLLRCGLEIGQQRQSYQPPELERLILEMGMLNAMQKKNLIARFQRSAEFFKEKTDPVIREKMIEFSLQMIAADGKITFEEDEYFNLLGKIWEMDTHSIIEKKIRELTHQGDHRNAD